MKIWKIKKLDPQCVIPTIAYNSNGFDLYALGDHVISVGETKIIPTGFAAELEPGYVACVWDRGSIGSKSVHTFHQLEIAPFAGVIDEDYRGMYGVVLHNFSKSQFMIAHGQKIAQILILKAEKPEIQIVEELSTTLRGAGALGSSDKGGTGKTIDAELKVSSTSGLKSVS